MFQTLVNFFKVADIRKKNTIYISNASYFPYWYIRASTGS